MDFAVLGPLRVTGDEGVVEVAGFKERALLAMLIAHRDRTVPSADLVDALWGARPPRSAVKSLQTFVLRVRNALEPDRSRMPRLLVTDGSGYRLAVPESAVDADRFIAMCKAGRTALAEKRPRQAAVLLRDGLSLWRGPAYAGFESTPFGAAEGRRLAEIRMTAIEDRLAAELDADGPDVVVPELERLLPDQPYRERLWSLLILALYRSGRQADALGAFDRARHALVDDLGIEPGRELRELHARVLEQDPALDPDHEVFPLPASLVATHPMLGRESELSWLTARWHEARAGSAVTALIRGPEGAGGNRLAQELAAEAAQNGAVVRVAGDPAWADLVIAARAQPPVPSAGQLVVVLAGPKDPAPAGAAVLDLKPLGPDAVRGIVAGYTAPSDTDRATADVIASSGGWPGSVHRNAVQWCRSTASDLVRAANESVARSAGTLTAARDELINGVLTLAEHTPRDASNIGECPWKGLAAYDVADARFFAGRERLVAELVARVASTRLLAIVGPSGSGKSSALRAGLMAAVNAGALPGSATWKQVLLRPGAHPMRELTRNALALTGSPDVALGDLLEEIVRGDGQEADRRVIVAIDQLEEVWTTCSDPVERSSFLDALADITKDARSSITVVLTVRADYLTELAGHEGLARPMADNTVLVGPPTPPEIARAVESPARAAGLRLDVGLTDSIVADAGCEPGLLPLLSTALTRLWSVKDGAQLTLSDYVQIGGLKGAIPGLAEEAFGALPGPDQAAARVLFLRLTGPGDNPATVTRRRVPLAELATLPDPAVRAVVDPMARARLLTVDDGWVEVAHEALFQEWPRLAGWLSEDSAGRAVQRRLAAAVADWDADGREPGLLWQGARLLAALDAAEQRPDEITLTEREFLDAAADLAEAARRDIETRAAAATQQNRRLRWLLGGIAVLLVAAVVAGGIAWTARQRAEAASVSADARRLAAQAVNEQHLDLGLLSAVEAARVQASPETYGALLTLLTRTPEIVTQVHASERFLRAVGSPDASTVFLGENQPYLSAVNADTGTALWRTELPGQPGKLAAAPDGRGVLTVASGPTGQDVVLVDTGDGRLRWSVRAADLVPRGADPTLGLSAGWLPDGRWAAAGSAGLFLASPDTGDPVQTIAWPSGLEPFLPDLLHVTPDGRIVVADTARSAVINPGDGTVRQLTVVGSAQALSSTGSLAAVDMTDPGRPMVRLYDPNLGGVGEPMPLTSYHGGISFSPDGTTLAVGNGEVLELRDAGTGDLLQELHGHNGAITDVVFTGQDGDLIWTAGRDGTAIAWDLSGRRGLLQSTRGATTAWLGDTASTDAIAVGLTLHEDRVGDVSLLDPRTGNDYHATLPMPTSCTWCDPTAVAITPDGATALAGVEDYPDAGGQPQLPAYPDRGYVALWNTATGALTATIPLPWPVQGIDTSPDGRRAIVNGLTGTVLVDLASDAVIWGPVPHDPLDDRDATGSAAVSPDGGVAVVGIPGGVRTLDMATGKVLASVGLTDRDQMSSAAFSADSATVIIGTYGGYTHVLNTGDLEPVTPRRLTTGGWVIDLATSPDGRYLASTGTDGDLLIWDAASWKPLGQPISDGTGWGWLSFDPESRTLRAVHQTGVALTFTVDPDGWLRAACQVANRDLTDDESALIRPGQAPRSTCQGLR